MAFRFVHTRGRNMMRAGISGIAAPVVVRARADLHARLQSLLYAVTDSDSALSIPMPLPNASRRRK
jgi:hypothetical protein